MLHRRTIETGDRIGKPGEPGRNPRWALPADKRGPTLFEDKRIRKILPQDEWWFSIIDVIAVLLGAAGPANIETT